MKFNLVRVGVVADRAQSPEDSDDELRAILHYARDRGMTAAVDVEQPSDSGSPWLPLFRANAQQRVYRKCVEEGVESICVPGWDISGVEHNVRYLADFAWNSELTAAEFHRQYVAALLGDAAVPTVNNLFRSYDELPIDTALASDDRAMLPGAGWMASAASTIPTTPEQFEAEMWKATVDRAGELLEQTTRLLEKDQQAIDVLRDVMSKQRNRNRDRTRLLINRLQFRMLCVRCVQTWNRALLSFDRVCREKGVAEARAAALKEAERCVDLARQAARKYAQEIHGRGDEEMVRRLNGEYARSVERFAAALNPPQEPADEPVSDPERSKPPRASQETDADPIPSPPSPPAAPGGTGSG